MTRDVLTREWTGTRLRTDKVLTKDDSVGLGVTEDGSSTQNDDLGKQPPERARVHLGTNWGSTGDGLAIAESLTGIATRPRLSLITSGDYQYIELVV